MPHRLAQLRVVEGRHRLVHAEDRLHADIVLRSDTQATVALHDGEEVGRQFLEDVDLAGDQGVQRGLRIRQVDPFDALDPGALAAGQAIRRLGARDIAWIAAVGDAVAGAPILPPQGEGAGPRRGR